MEKDFNGNSTTYGEGEKVQINPQGEDRLDAYRGEFRMYKPKFKGRYENEYPNRWYSYIIQTLMLFPIYIICGLLMWGFIEWGLRSPKSWGWTNFGLFCFYVLFIFTMVYVFGADRRKREREFISSKFQDNMLKKEKRRLEAEQNAQLLRDYRRATTQRRGVDDLPRSHEGEE